jgi:hypothetical protein
MSIPTTVAPTVGDGLSGHRSTVGLISSTGQQFATGMLLAHNSGSYLFIKSGIYRPAIAPITRAFMLPVGSINISSASPMPSTTSMILCIVPCA